MSGYSNSDALPFSAPSIVGPIAKEADLARVERATEQVTRYFHAYRKGLYLHLVHAQLLPAAEAEEITQDAFLALHRALLDGKEIESVAAWVFKVGRNLASKHRRRQRYERPMLIPLCQVVADTVADRAPTSEESLLAAQRLAALEHARATLTPLQTQCLELRAEGLSLREISQIAGIPAKRVSDAACRAIRRLQRYLNERV